jgi:predicted metal-dependent peptidase
MENKLIISRAVTQLAITAPFFGSIALSTRIKEDTTIDTMCTDGQHIWWSPDFVERMHQQNAQYNMAIIAHEVAHIVLHHHLRRGERDPELWNIACDFVVNLILKDAGFDLPEGALLDDQYKGMTAEQVYDRLSERGDIGKLKSKGMGEVIDPKDKNGQPISDSEAKQMAADVNAKVLMAAETARMRGNMPAALKDHITKIKRAEIDLHSVMARFMGGVNPDEWSTSRPNRRKIKSQGIVAPTIVKTGCGNVVFSIDTSGSVKNRELSYFLGVANQMVDEMRPTSVTVITWDAKVRTVRRYEEGEEIKGIEIGGRGGTLVGPSFRHVEDEEVPCDQMIVLSDLMIHDYPDAPDYPVLWVSSYDGASDAPFGQTTYLNCA